MFKKRLIALGIATLTMSVSFVLWEQTTGPALRLTGQGAGSSAFADTGGQGTRVCGDGNLDPGEQCESGHPCGAGFFCDYCTCIPETPPQSSAASSSAASSGSSTLPSSAPPSSTPSSSLSSTVVVPSSSASSTAPPSSSAQPSSSVGSSALPSSAPPSSAPPSSAPPSSAPPSSVPPPSSTSRSSLPSSCRGIVSIDRGATTKLLFIDEKTGMLIGGEQLPAGKYEYALASNEGKMYLLTMGVMWKYPLTIPPGAGNIEKINIWGVAPYEINAMGFGLDGYLYMMDEDADALYQVHPLNGQGRVARIYEPRELDVRSGDITWENEFTSLYINADGHLWRFSHDTFAATYLGQVYHPAIPGEISGLVHGGGMGAGATYYITIGTTLGRFTLENMVFVPMEGNDDLGDDATDCGGQYPIPPLFDSSSSSSGSVPPPSSGSSSAPSSGSSTPSSDGSSPSSVLPSSGSSAPSSTPPPSSGPSSGSSASSSDGSSLNSSAQSSAAQCIVNSQCIPGQQCITGTCIPFQCDDEIDCTADEDCIGGFCISALCGNGRRDGTEECDDGNAVSTDSCTAICFLARCGDTYVQNAETCDDGVYNADLADVCRTDCQLPTCGDGIVDIDEDCDDGNRVAGDDCSNNCRVAARCGNDIREDSEWCDDGNGDDADGCTSLCMLSLAAGCERGDQCDSGYCLNGICAERPVCGDGVVQSGEGCDQGTANSNIIPNRCRLSCLLASVGDGVIDNGEECDDGNRINGDGCDAQGHRERIAGSAVVDRPIEQASSSSVTLQIIPVTLPAALLSAPLPAAFVSHAGAPGNPETGPATILLMASGAAGGLAWIRRRRR